MPVNIYRAVANIGEKLLSILNTCWGMSLLLYDTLLSFFSVITPGHRGNKSFKTQLSFQVLFTGVEAFWLVGLIALTTGGAIIVQAIFNMPMFGVGEYFGNLLVMTIVRELGPLITALVVIGRSGAAISVFLGNMKVNKEISALESMGIEPVDYLVMPAVVSMVISMVCLNIYFSLVSIIGGLIVARVVVDLQVTIFLDRIFEALRYTDLLMSLAKSIVFGVIISIVACYYGLSVKNVREVSMAVIKSVVATIFLTLVTNIVITSIYHAR